MKLDFGDYRIVTDEHDYIVQRKKTVQAGRFTKEENVGKEYYEDMAYCRTLDFALKFLANNVVLENDDILVIKRELKALGKQIDAFTKALSSDIEEACK